MIQNSQNFNTFTVMNIYSQRMESLKGERPNGRKYKSANQIAVFQIWKKM